MQVRALRWGDCEPLVENFLALYDEVKVDPDVGISLLDPKPSMGAEGEWFARLFRNVELGRTIAVVAEAEGRAVGLCTIEQRGPSHETSHRGVLGILIGRRWRGRGAGRALIEQALRECRGKFDVVELTVFATNPRARRLYESLGFRSWGVLPRGIQRNGRSIDLDHMVLEVPTR